MFIQKEINLRKRRWLELLKDYDMSILNHPSKANIVVEALSRLSMGVLPMLKKKRGSLLKICRDLHDWE